MRRNIVSFARRICAYRHLSIFLERLKYPNDISVIVVCYFSFRIDIYAHICSSTKLVYKRIYILWKQWQYLRQ